MIPKSCFDSPRGFIYTEAGRIRSYLLVHKTAGAHAKFRSQTGNFALGFNETPSVCPVGCQGQPPMTEMRHSVRDMERTRGVTSRN